MSNLSIVVPKEMINGAIEKGIKEYRELTIKIGADFGFEVLELIRENFKIVKNDLTIAGIFLYILQNEQRLHDDIRRIGGGHVNPRLTTMPIVDSLLNLNPTVMLPLWIESMDGAKQLDVKKEFIKTVLLINNDNPLKITESELDILIKQIGDADRVSSRDSQYILSMAVLIKNIFFDEVYINRIDNRISKEDIESFNEFFKQFTVKTMKNV